MNEHPADVLPKLTDSEFRAAVLAWLEKAVDAFEGAPGPSEIEGKWLVAEALSRGWESK